jgi:hypothetical protein
MLSASTMALWGPFVVRPSTRGVTPGLACRTGDMTEGREAYETLDLALRIGEVLLRPEQGRRM